MHFLKTWCSLCLLLAATMGRAQSVTPIFRFFPEGQSQTPYDDSLFSGFMQSAPSARGAAFCPDGFLQMPFIGDPLLVYVGEKDSTQFTAYASACQMEQQSTSSGSMRALLTRYGIQATVTSAPGYVEQEYAYPDTTADKGFLIDFDHALTGEGNEDMDVTFVTKQDIRAYKRCYQGGASDAQLYYFAHFSAPFETWNIRRERVTLENGSKEPRCKVAFTFKLKKGETLKVQSAVSAFSTDDAYAQLPVQHTVRHFADVSHKRPVNNDELLLAQAEAERKRNAPTTQRQTAAPKRSVTTSTKRQPTKQTASAKPAEHYSTQDKLFEVATRDASLKAAFYAALAQLRTSPEIRRAQTAAEFIKSIVPLYPASTPQGRANAQHTDSLLHQYATAVFTGKDVAQLQAEEQGGEAMKKLAPTAQAAWFVFNALGFRPTGDGNAYKLVRPALNVATLQMQQGRRLVLYVKRAAPQRRRIASATLGGIPLEQPYIFTHSQLMRGGMLEVKMEE